MQVMRVMCVLGCALAAAASATAPQARKVTTTANVQASADATWDALIDLFAEHNWAITNVERSSGLITTDWMSLGSDGPTVADCGGSGLSSEDGTSVRFNVRVKEQEAGAVVTVGAGFRQSRSYDGKQWTVDCVSKGTIERLIHREVASRSAQAERRAPKVTPARAKAPPPRGHFCAVSATTPSAGLCTRKKADCARSRDAVLAVVADLAECTLVEEAWCYADDDDAEHCYPAEAGCADQQQRMAALDACTARE